MKQIILTQFGNLEISADKDGITGVRFVESFSQMHVEIEDKDAKIWLEKGIIEIEAYLSGHLKAFTVPMVCEGTQFQKIVWHIIREIPYGQRLSYKQIAEQIGRPKSYRAVGTACGKNPLLILVPCHRVVGMDKKLHGYSGGLLIKEKLLEMEQEN